VAPVTTYITLALLKTSLGIPVGDTVDDTLLELARSTASRSVDKSCGGRRFWIDETTSARTFRPARRVVWDRDGSLLMLDDIAEIGGLVVEVGTTGSWTALTDYEPYPENALVKGKPVTGLLRTAWQMGGFGFRVRVTAKWGWPAVPDEVQTATLIQAGRLYKRKDSPDGIAGSAEWGPIRVSRVDPDVQKLIDDLVDPGIA